MGELYLDQLERCIPSNGKPVFKTMPPLTPDTRYITSDSIHPVSRELPETPPEYLMEKNLTYCQ